MYFCQKLACIECSIWDPMIGVKFAWFKYNLFDFSKTVLVNLEEDLEGNLALHQRFCGRKGVSKQRPATCHKVDLLSFVTLSHTAKLN